MTLKATSVLLVGQAILSGLGLVPARVHVPAVQEQTGGAARELLESKIRCIAYSSGWSVAKIEAAIAKSAVDVAAYVCDDGPEDKAKAIAIAEATATAYAVAVTDASVVCEGEGNVNFYANAKSNAKAAAEVFLEAYAAASAVAGDCEKCSAYAESFNYVAETVFLEAVSASEATIDGYADAASGPSKLGSARAFRKVAKSYDKSVASATASAFAKAIGVAKKVKNVSGCRAWTFTEACITQPAGEKCGTCESKAEGFTLTVVKDAISEAGAAAIAYTCSDSSSHSEAEAIAEVEVAADEVARALAVAISSTYAHCDQDEGAYSCAYGAADTKALAKAVAKAFAEAWAQGYTCDDTCSAESEAVVEAVEPVIAKAAANAFSSICTDSAGKWTVESLAVSIAKNSKKAIAEAAALAVSHSTDAEECYAVAVAEAYVG